MELVSPASTQVMRPLRVLVPLIKEDLQDIEKSGLPYKIAAGQKLLEAKSQVRYGAFSKWLEENFTLSHTTANKYMGLATATADRENKAQEPFSSLHQYRRSKGMKQTVHPQPWHEPIKEAIGRVDIKALKQDALAKQAERALQRKLALTLIDIGYKALATKLHSDKGGSDEAMRRLNRVRELLKAAVTA